MKRILLSVIHFYQRMISPIFGSHCRFYPSCSEYTRMAIEKNGAFKGAFYGLTRILRCNPLFKGGVDMPPHCDHEVHHHG